MYTIAFSVKYLHVRLQKFLWKLHL